MKITVLYIAYSLATMSLIQLGFQNTSSQEIVKNVMERPPEFFTLEWKQGTKLTKKKTLLFIEVDSLDYQDISVLVNIKGQPVLYVSDISTPVCADGECRAMNIRLYWSLLGGYAGFDRYPGLPLTKHDHDEFQKEDYKKLHLLLMDGNSILKRRKIDELIEKREVLEAGKADAISGATISEVKESVVEGALYSCYTAWHIVHGKIKEELKDHTLPMMDHNIVAHMLESNNANYQLFALSRLNDLKYEQNRIRISNIFESGIPLVRAFIIKNLPEFFWKRDDLQALFWNSFDRLDVNTRSLLLERLTNAPESTMFKLSQHLHLMTKNQLKMYLREIKEGERINSKIKTNLELFANSDIEAQSYLVQRFLEQKK